MLSIYFYFLLLLFLLIKQSSIEANEQQRRFTACLMDESILADKAIVAGGKPSRRYQKAISKLKQTGQNDLSAFEEMEKGAFFEDVVTQNKPKPRGYKVVLIEGSITDPTPLILGWNNFQYFGNVIEVMNGLDNVAECPYLCHYSSNKAVYATASAIVFYIRIGYGHLPAKRFPHQLYAFYLDEPPVYTFDLYKNLPPDFFNITISYRADSDVYFPYDQFVPIKNECQPDEIWTENQILQTLSKKTKLALQVNSDCETRSKREELVQDLQRFINISLFGKCLNSAYCDWESCYNRELDSHFFYLAFENSVCRNYVTEKFWNLKRLIVPVVLTRRVFSGLDIPTDSFIAADDFGSTKELADHMIMLQQNHSAYLSYFRWTKHYRKTNYHALRRPLSQKYHQSAIKVQNPTPAAGHNPLCKLCELLHHQQKQGHPRRRVDDIWRWWQGPSVCIDDFVPRWKQGRLAEAFAAVNWQEPKN